MRTFLGCDLIFEAFVGVLPPPGVLFPPCPVLPPSLVMTLKFTGETDDLVDIKLRVMTVDLWTH